MFRNSLLATLTACTLALALGQSQAVAQVKPFKITGEGFAPEGLGPPPIFGGGIRPHNIVGNATHLGKHYGAGTEQTDTFEPQPNGHITGEFGSGSPFVFTGANGEILSCNYGSGGGGTPGTYELVPVPGDRYVAFFIAEFVPIGDQCTGKFAGVKGSWIMYAVSEPFLFGEPFAYSWQGEGSLNFKKGK